MFFAFVLLFLISAGGFAVTYLYDRDAPFYVRIAAGIVIGEVIYSLVCFLLACAAGMSFKTAAFAAVLTALPFLILRRTDFLPRLRGDWQQFLRTIKEVPQRLNAETIAAGSVYVLLTILLWFFFERAMLNINGGIGTGSPHNTGDISFHLQAIYGFLDGQNYPPQNPSFAGAKFTYPFMADLVTAALATAEARISDVMFWQNMFLVVALTILMARFTFKLTESRFAALIAPLLLLFSGGLGFMLFLNDAMKNEAGFFNALMQMTENYTLRAQTDLRWGNSLTVLFMTQRSLLLGLPLALIIFTKFWEKFFSAKSKNPETLKQNSAIFNFKLLALNSDLAVVGLLAGTLPLVHAHSFAVVMGMAVCLALMSWRQWREWFVFFAFAGVISASELLWAISRSATKAENFVDWQFGWDNNGAEFFWFWFMNTGFFIPLLLAAVALLIIKSFKLKTKNADGERRLNHDETNSLSLITRHSSLALLLFWLPFALCFVVPNVVRLAPWIWDNIKVLIYWFAVSIPLAAWLLAQIWRRGAAGKTVTIALVLVLTLSGWLDVWRVASRQMEYTVFDRDAVILAREARKKIAPDAIVASAPRHDSPAALMGRRWFIGFIGHLWSHGINPTERENQLKEIYYGSPNAEQYLRETGIQYLVVSPQEYDYTVVNENYLSRFPIAAQAGDYRLLQVK